MTDTLNLGILLAGDEIPSWQFALVENALQIEAVSVELIVAPSSPGQASWSAGRLCRAMEKRDGFKPSPELDPMALRSLAPLSDRVAATHRLPHSLPAEQVDLAKAIIERMGSRRPDIVLALCKLESRKQLADIARYGTWFYWHDYGQTFQTDGIGCGLWEVFKRQPIMRSALLIERSSRKAHTVAYESRSAVHTLSARQTRTEHLWKIQGFVARVLRRLVESGNERFLDRLPTWNVDIETERARWSLTDARLAAPILGYIWSRLRQKLQKQFYDQRWILMYSNSGRGNSINRFTRILPPADRFWADPHALERDGNLYAFFEDASVETGLGRIAVTRIEEDGEYSDPVTVLERPYHLSYPFVFDWQGETYMIPESADNKTVELYRFTAFPGEVEFVRNLLVGLSAYDATLVEHEGRWWMFVNVRSHDGASSWDELCLYYADSPLSDSWQAHKMNPVVSDVSSARPAGCIYRQDGKLYRPSQDSSYRYGYGLNICRIDSLTTEDYEEERVEHIAPHGPISAIHTLSSIGNRVLIDAVYRSRRRSA